MEPRIIHIGAKKLIGQHVLMSLADNRTFELWRGFMPRRKEITNNLNTDLISMKVCHEPVDIGRMDQLHEKWAAIEVSSFEFVPPDMETFELPGGTYAVFHYKGLNTDPRIFIYIFTDWLPNSEYELDDRPHFEILGVKYKNNDPDSEEEIYIPVRPKSER
ncbi:GyrI-like domain-containing protein [Flavobacterium sp. CYK-4]|uniref:GyrI-like domain-containing protein n=1 Tax=Flavobacterium lotistagni TaxID=2709660 RepID=UPI001407AB77|nr:GyrI-like domain-containing protein [Flavobacterium lotistagni]NHM06962.1 GyrI-like domain-containing protein [Flavobacterium lotistagni]